VDQSRQEGLKRKVDKMRLLTAQEVAEILQINPRTVKRLPITQRRIGKQIRYTRADVNKYVRLSAEFEHEKKEETQRHTVARGSKALGVPKVLSWDDLQRIVPNGGRG
jgi:hypothetical protein